MKSQLPLYFIYSQHTPLLRLQFCLAHSARVWAPSSLVCIYLHVISTSNLQTWKGRLVKKYFASPSPLHLSLFLSHYLSHSLFCFSILASILNVWLEEQLYKLNLSEPWELYQCLDICYCDFVYKRKFSQLSVCVYKHLKVHFASVVFADCWLFTNYESHWDDETIPLTQWIALIRVNDDVNTHQSSLWVKSKHALSHKASAQTISELAVICSTFSECKHSFRNSPPLCSSRVCIFSSKSLWHISPLPMFPVIMWLWVSHNCIWNVKDHVWQIESVFVAQMLEHSFTNTKDCMSWYVWL